MKNDRRETPIEKQNRIQGKLRPNPAAKSDSRLITTPGSGISLRDSVTLSVGSDGNCVLNYTSTVCGDDDFVGVYANASLPENEHLAWEWCTHTSDFPYDTGVPAQVGYVGIYWSKDYRTGNYVAVAITSGLPSTAPGTQVHQSST